MKQLTAITERLNQLESWAHGVDVTIQNKQQTAHPSSAHGCAIAQTSSELSPDSDLTSSETQQQDGVPAEADSMGVLHKIAEIEKTIRDGEQSMTPRNSLSNKVALLEGHVEQILDNIRLLGLRPVSEALGSDATNHDLELDLNWRLGMLEMTVAAHATDMLSLRTDIDKASSRP
eukprot:4510186-Amphidinium_carterae.1